jgi:hypothetical protein
LHRAQLERLESQMVMPLDVNGQLAEGDAELNKAWKGVLQNRGPGTSANRMSAELQPSLGV